MNPKNIFKKKMTSLALAMVLGVGSLLPFMSIPKVYAATNQVFRLEAIEDENGEAITGGYISLQARTKGENSEEEWFTVHLFKLNGKTQRYTFEEDDSKYDFRYKAEQLPLGYKVETPTIALNGTKQATFNILRDREGVEAAVAKSTYDLQIHTVPPVTGAKFYLEEIPKPENLETVHSSRPYHPTYDLGSIFAAWRKREEMISVAQPAHSLSLVTTNPKYSDALIYPHQRKEVDQSFSILPFENHSTGTSHYRILGDELQLYIQKPNSYTTLNNGKVKIQNIEYSKWWRFMRVPSELDTSLVLYESKDQMETDRILNIGENDPTNIKKGYKFTNNFIGEKFTLEPEKIKENEKIRNYTEADWIVIKGPRSVNTAKTKYVYDVYVKTAEEGNLEEAIKQDVLTAYEGLLTDVESVSVDEIDNVRLAIEDLSTDAALYREELEKLKRLLERLEKEQALERATHQIEKAKALVEKAKESGLEEDIEKATLAVNGLIDGEEKTKLLEELARLKQPKTYEVSYTFRAEDQSELPQEVKNQVPETEQKRVGEIPQLKVDFNRVPGEKNGRQGNWIFDSWDKVATAIENAPHNYVGIWRFEENAPSPEEIATEKANNFREEYANVLAKTVENITESDRASVEAALGKYATLETLAKAKLSSEKAKLDELLAKLNATKETERQATEKANNFREEYANVLAKTVENITESDRASVEAALGKYATLEALVKAKLSSEKAKLDELLAKLNATKETERQATEKANNFREEYANVLAKTVENITESDRASVEAALGKYATLEALVKAKLSSEKAKLDELLAKLNATKEEKETIVLPKGIGFNQWYPDQIIQVPQKLKYYDGEHIKLEGLVMKYVRYIYQDGHYVKEEFEVPYEKIKAFAKGWKLINKTPIAQLSEAKNGKLKIRLSFELENEKLSKEN